MNARGKQGRGTQGRVKETDDIKKFLLQHPDFFRIHLSGMYPLSAGLIDKYKDFWDWGCLTDNEALPWTTEFFYRFEDHWFYCDEEHDYAPSVLGNDVVPWSMEFLKKHKKGICWQGISQSTELLTEFPEILEVYKNILEWSFISGNEYLPWTAEMAEQFQDYIDWNILSGNRKVNWNACMRERWSDKFNLDRYISGNYEPWYNTIAWNERITPNLSAQIEESKYTLKYTPEEFDAILKEGHWDSISFDKRVPWTPELIDYYKDKWNWMYLSENPALPWTEKLIDKYIDRWFWGRAIPNKEGWEFDQGLSINPGLPWSAKLIKKYYTEWFWHDLSYNTGLPWSIELINEFYNDWHWDNLVWNDDLWGKVLDPFLNEEIIDEVAGQIVKTGIPESARIIF